MDMDGLKGPIRTANYIRKTTSGNVTLGDEAGVVVDKSSGAATTVTLPANPTAGDYIFVKDGKGDAATNNITVTPSGSQTIEGQSSFVIDEAYGGVMLFYDSDADWKIASRMSSPSAGAGAVAGSGVSVQELGNAVVHKTVLTFADAAIALTDNAGVVAYGGLKVYDFPEGAILMLGAVADLDLTKSSAGVNDDWDGDFGVGTVTASNNNTLSSTEQNIIPTTATPQASSGATTANGLSTATENAVINGTSTAVDVYLNLLVDDADHDVTSTPCNLIVNGTLTLTWVKLGDF